MHMLRALILASMVAIPSLGHGEEPVAPPSEAVPTIEEILSPMASERVFRDATVAVQVVDVLTGEVVFAHDSDRKLNPASTMKVLTAATALKTLGPSYRFTTDLFVDGTVDGAGVLQGNLYVKGGGDPTLVVEKLWKLVLDLKLEGIERIAGDVVYDESYFGTDHHLPGWDKEEDLERGPSYFPELSALSLNFNTIAIVVAPGREVGEAARIRLETPASAYVTLVNEVTTSSSGSWRRLDIKREITDPTITFTLEGSIPAGSEVRKYYRTVAEPTSHFMAAFEEMLASQDVVVTGKHKRGTTPEGATLLVRQQSTSLAAILMDMNKFSNNFIAEQVLRAMAAEVKGAPGTTAAGVEVIHDYLVDLGIPDGSFTLVNGSGLSRDSFLTPEQLTTVLVDMAKDPRVGHEFTGSLAISGRDGTLFNRLTEAPGRLRGKTGTIDGVHCLTGYVEGTGGRLFAFAFLVNDVRGGISKVKSLQDRFLAEILAAGNDAGAEAE